MSEEFEGAHKGMIVAGQYKIIRLLGGGLTSDVWEASEVSIERPVALKVIRPILSRDSAVQERFERERKVQGNLRHDHIVRIFAADKSEPVGLWMAMELMNRHLGETFTEQRPLDAIRAVGLLAPIADALDYAHKRGRVHRDVKPANILLDDQGRPHLSDFGIAMIRGVTRITATGGLIGTPGYAAPEQERGEEVDGSADVYSLSVVLFQTVTGTMPNPVVGPAGEVDWDEVPSASLRNPALPSQFDAVVRRGMSANPKDRYPTAAALIVAARQAIEVTPAAPEVVRPKPAGRPAVRRRRRRRASAAGVLGLLLLFGVGIGAGASTEADPPAQSPTAARAGALELEAPPGWRSRGGERPSIPGFGLRQPIELRADDGSAVLAAGISGVRGPTLLAGAYRDQAAADPGRRKPIALGSLQAYRYTGLTAPGTSEPLTVFVAPTSSGVATLACRAGREETRSEAAALCGRIATTLRLRRGKLYRLGPSPGFARALRIRMERLSESGLAGRRAMDDAAGGGEQAAAARSLAKAYGRAGAELASIPVTPESAWGRKAVVGGLGAMREAYANVAAAAGAEDEAAYEAAGDMLNQAEKRYAAALDGLTELGYRVGS